MYARMYNGRECGKTQPSHAEQPGYGWHSMACVLWIINDAPRELHMQ